MDACAIAALKVALLRWCSRAFHHRKEKEASSRMVSPSAGLVGRTPQTWPRHYNVATSPLSQAWDATQTKTPNTPGQAGFLSPQKHVNRAGATVFFSHKTPQRGIDQDVTQEVVFFFFHGNLSHNISSKTFQRKKTMVTKGQNDPLAGRAGSRIWKTSLHQ